MKFSVLLPTRNRLELLRYAVETVRRQDYEDWEIIVSDNFSEEDISGYIRSLDDPRIKYYRTDRFLPVTDNWNNALEKATGEYIVTLGDDDCLMKGYFSTLRGLVETYDHPDFIYANAYLYAYPGVMPDYPNGFLDRYDYARFLHSSKDPFLLDESIAKGMARQSMDMRISFTYNMQHSVIRRGFIDSLASKGKFFQSPYPDFYATNVMFLTAKRILIFPRPIVTIGISPKSFGYYFFNYKEKSGVEFLKNLPDIDPAGKLGRNLLPGSYNTTFWLLAMEAILSNYGSDHDLRVNYRRYRFKQILYVFAGYYRNNTMTEMELRELWSRMRLWEKLAYGVTLWFMYRIANVIPKGLRQVLNQWFAAIFIRKDIHLRKAETMPGYKNILDVFEQVDPLANERVAPLP